MSDTDVPKPIDDSWLFKVEPWRYQLDRANPPGTIEIGTRINHTQEQRTFIHAAHLDVAYGSRMVAQAVRATCGGGLGEGLGWLELAFPMRLRREDVEWLDAERELASADDDGGIVFDLRLAIDGAFVGFQRPEDRVQFWGASLWRDVELAERRVHIRRVDWHRLLRWTGVADLAVYELPRLLIDLPFEYGEALEQLRQARRFFADGDWPQVLVCTRSAFEALGSQAEALPEGDEHHEPTPDIAGADWVQGIDRLLQVVLEGDAGEPYRRALHELLKQLGKFQHVGRHRRHPFPEISRNDALFALRQTLSIFEYIGREYEARRRRTGDELVAVIADD